MKKKTFQTVAVIVAFLTGVTINYSCGDDKFQTDSGSVAELWSVIESMRGEIDALKGDVTQLQAEVALLRAGSGNGGGTGSGCDCAASVCGEFRVGDLWFSRNGEVCSRLLDITERTKYEGWLYTYTYDETGRLVETFLKSLDAPDDVETMEKHAFEYSGKTVTETVTSGYSSYTRVKKYE